MENRDIFYNKINEEIKEMFQSGINNKKAIDARKLLEDLYKTGYQSDNCLHDARQNVRAKICMFVKETNYKNNDKLIETTVTFEKNNNKFIKQSNVYITNDPIIFGLTSHESIYKTNEYKSETMKYDKFVDL